MPEGAVYIDASLVLALVTQMGLRVLDHSLSSAPPVILVDGGRASHDEGRLGRRNQMTQGKWCVTNGRCIRVIHVPIVIDVKTGWLLIAERRCGDDWVANHHFA